MCRSIERGGRRCPAHSDPVKVTNYNAVRRERYQAVKSFPEAPGRPVAAFLPYSETRYEVNRQSSQWAAYSQDAKEYLEVLQAQGLQTFQRHQQALENYTGLNWDGVRDYLNGMQMLSITSDNKPAKFHPTEEKLIQSTIKDLDEALALAPKPSDPRIVYRGMTIPMSVPSGQISTWLADNFSKGGVVSQKSYMSTSLSASRASNFLKSSNTARTVIFEIMTKQGAVLGDHTSTFGEEETEVLIPRNAKFKVESVNEEIPYLTSHEADNSIHAPQPGKARRTVIRLIDATEKETNNV